MAGELERVRKALRELGKSIESLPADPAPAAIHKLRTASRRVETIAAALAAVDGKKSRRLVKSIEPVRKAAGDVRDMDVMMAGARKLARHAAGASLSQLLDHLETVRKLNAGELQHALHHRRKALLRDLKEYSRSVSPALKHAKSSRDGDQSQEKIHDAAMNVVRALDDWPPLDAGNLHEFRLKVKQLRYTLQLDADADPVLVEALGDVQRRAGDWHDWQQLADIAHRILVRDEDRELLDRIDAAVARRFHRALEAAYALRAKYLAAPLAVGA